MSSAVHVGATQLCLGLQRAVPWKRKVIGMKVLGTCRARRCPPLEGGVVCVVTPDRHEGGRKSEYTLIFFSTQQAMACGIHTLPHATKLWVWMGEFG